MAIEREVKLGAWAGFRLPDLHGVAADVTVVPRPTQTLTAVYYDTPDLRLARWGVTLRHRSGAGHEWTVKLPDGDDGPALVRRELNFDRPASHVPPEASELVLAYARGVPLGAVARLRTVRCGVDVVDREGTKIAEVVDDEVSVMNEGRVAARFREVEVELGERAPAGLLDAVVSSLRAAGAGAPDPTPKVVRALGPRALAPPDVEVYELGRRATTADVVTHAIATSVTRILRHDPGVRIGDDPEDVHQARVGTRRLRSDLRTFAPVLDESWLAALRDDLRWLAGSLGAVRDSDVLDERLRHQAAGMAGSTARVEATLFRQLAAERDRARAALAEAMASPRYVALLDELVAAARAPRLGDGADRRAPRVVPKLVARPWRKLRSQVKGLPAEPSADDLHQVRIRAKRARYAAEAAAPMVGGKAASFARALARLQTVLGDHQDAIVAEAWLRGFVASTDPAAQATVAELIALQQAEAEHCRRRWRAAWTRASAKSLRSWL